MPQCLRRKYRLVDACATQMMFFKNVKGNLGI